MPNYCSQCGRCRSCGRQRVPVADNGVFATPLNRPGTCPDNQGLGAELYGSPLQDNGVPAVCDDYRCSGQVYDRRSRCPYWPSFSHPRWLRCNDLYGRRL